MKYEIWREGEKDGTDTEEKVNDRFRREGEKDGTDTEEKVNDRFRIEGEKDETDTEEKERRMGPIQKRMLWRDS